MNFKISLLIALTLVPTASQARWMTPQEADFSVEEQSTQLEVRADGRAVSTMTVRLKVLNENGRQALGSMHFSYNPGQADFKVVLAESKIGDGPRVKVASDLIVDQPIRGAEVGFDDVREVLVSYPQVQVGSELSYKLYHKITRPDVENQYSSKSMLGEYGFTKSAEYHIVSERKLYLYVNDPSGALEVVKNEPEKEKEKGKKFVYDIRLKKPVLNKIFDEPMSLLGDRKLTWFVVSTAPDYQTLAGPEAMVYEKTLSAPLPPQFRDLVDGLKQETDPMKKIARLLAELAGRVRYMGDWRAVEGRMYPRQLKKIALTQSGDCKDMAVTATKMLREMGIDAWVALVWRGPVAPQVPDVPYLGFNHAIVYAKLPNNRTLWLDPTNFQSFPDGVFEDIAERQALVLNPAKVTLEKIEFPQADRSQEKVKIQVHLTGAGTEVNQVWIYHTGSMALAETGSLLKYSEAQFEQGTLNNITTRSDVLSYSFELPDLKDRIVKPLETKIKYERRFRPAETSMGSAVEFSSPELISGLAKLVIQDRESDVRLGPPSLSEVRIDFDNLRVRGHLKGCRVASPWIDYSFDVTTRPQVQIESHTDSKVFAISAEDIASPKFAEFQKQLELCARAKYLVFNSVEPKVRKRVNGSPKETKGTNTQARR